ncbi:GPW/gp25 family protein [Bacterioplanoides sp.]|uniref:GPW/gp25 family protein n=1 Tax=Bacterioplanoides sp. TaxID=2066072 RepID=UPI003AFF9BDF
MAGKRLLKRIEEWQAGKKSTADSYDLPDEIAADIELLLNTQRGNVLIDENMGLPDLRSMFQSHSGVDVEFLSEEMEYQISHYEKRLGGFKLKYDEKNSTAIRLSWQFNANVEGLSNQEVNASIYINMDGRVQVEPLA